MIKYIVVNNNDIKEKWGIITSVEDNSYRLNNERPIYNIWWDVTSKTKLDK